MVDTVTRERVVIHGEGNGGPYLMVPDEQLPAVVDVLRSHDITHWVDEDTISVDGEPAVAVVNLSRGTDVAAVQRLLDAA